MAWTFCPGRRRSRSRMALGITIWNFGEMVIVVIRIPYRSQGRLTRLYRCHLSVKEVGRRRRQVPGARPRGDEDARDYLDCPIACPLDRESLTPPDSGDNLPRSCEANPR